MRPQSSEFMKDVQELSRHGSPGGRPQPLAFHGETLWIGSWDTSSLYAIDTKTWSVLDEVAAPGKPYGLASFEGALRAVISIGEDEDRYFYTFVPGQGFDAKSKIECPERTGSHLTSDGSVLYLVQSTFGRILKLDAAGTVLREIPMPSRCGGASYAAGTFHIISADAEFDVLEFATLDIELPRPTLAPVAAMAPEARGLAFDGTTWWTNYRELNEIVSFAAP